VKHSAVIMKAEVRPERGAADSAAAVFIGHNPGRNG